MAKGSGSVAAKVEALVRPTIEAMGLRLWDVRYEKEGPEWFLRIFIDRDGPLDTDTCEAASRAIDPILDEADPIEDSYFLEVGSPGLGRRLIREEHFAAAQGQKVAARLFRPTSAGSREVSGILQAADADTLVILTEGGEETVEKKNISHCKLCDDEDLFG